MSHDPAQVARICYAAIRQLREERGLRKGPVWSLLISQEREWLIDAVRRTHIGLHPRRVFEFWRTDLEADGWKEGRDIDFEKRTHPALRDWDDLDQDVRDQFVLLQLMAVGMELSPIMSGLSRVTAP